MADSVAGSYASLAGIEIINEARTLAYLKNGLAPASMNVSGDCACEGLRQLIGCDDNPYSNPASDGAPWYTPSIPESANFAGFIVQRFEGLDSPFERSVVESVGNGGILTRSRLKSREMTWRGYLFGATCCATLYGFTWLKRTLSRFDSNCKDCFGDDLDILVCCPCDEDAATTPPFRTLKGVGLVEGPSIVSERKTSSAGGCSTGGCGGSCIMEIEFTMVATQPYLYSPEIPVYNCLNVTDGAVAPYTQAQIDCGPFDCADPFFEGGTPPTPASALGFDCVTPALPPTASYTNSCLNDFETPMANYFTVQRTLWSDLEEVIPIISLTTGAFPVGPLKLGFYSSPNGNPCADLSLYPPDCDVICDELNILFIPANSTFYVDSRTRKMSLICADGSAFPGERLTAGPWSWPAFGCYGFCLEIIYDTSQANTGVSAVGIQDVCLSLSLVPRTF